MPIFWPPLTIVVQAKIESERAMKEQHADVAAKKVEQAEARLQFLLNQSDIFAHFGVGQKPMEGAMSPAAGRKSAAGEHRQRGAAVAELDDEELEMIEEEDADEEVMKKKRRIGDVISKQPTVITGEMRYLTRPVPCLSLSLSTLS